MSRLSKLLFSRVGIQLLLMAVVSIHIMAQSPDGDKLVSLNKTNAPLREIFSEITKQTDFYFIGSADKLNQEERYTIRVEKESVNKVLSKLLGGKGFTWQIRDNIIALSKVERNQLVEKDTSFTIVGNVADEKGQPLNGVSVSVKGTTQGGITQRDGSFSIQGKSSKVTLVFSMIGYETVERAVSSDRRVIINLKVVSSDLGETVIKGYYKTTRILNTGSVGTLKGTDIAKQPVSDPIMALEGRIPGMYVSQNTGVPGGSINVNIRGLNSISNGTDPLYIIDGIPFNSKSLSQTENAARSSLSPFTSIRPEDIESIDVLKDADATAIYGSRGANGVILITTKKGKAGKTQMNVNVNYGTGNVSKRLHLMNTEQFLEMRKEGYKNDNATPEGYANDVNGVWDQSRYTDWQELMIGGTAHVTDAKASLSGGNANTQFLLAAGYRRETTVFPGDYVNQIWSSNVNVSHVSENKKFKVSFSGNYANNNNHLPIADFTKYIFIAPDAPAIYTDKGQINWENNTFNNPFGLLLQKANSVTENLISNLIVTYDLPLGFQLKGSVGYNSIRLNDYSLVPYASINPINLPAEDNRINNSGSNQIKSWIVEPQLLYNKHIKDHRIDALIAATFQASDQNGLTQISNGYSSDALIENPGSATFLMSNASYSQYRYSAVFARIGYNYREKYIINLTGRRDGSSRFGPGKRFGNFGAIGAAWVFSKENWVSDHTRWLSLGKIRGSIGKTGNDQISDYRYLSTYGSAIGYMGVSGLAPDKIANPVYAWETINKIELALELGFLDNKVLLNTSVYRNRTGNQLVGYSLPNITGFNTVIANLPAVIQNRGLEIDITTYNLNRKHFSWSTAANISFPENKLVSYPNLAASSYVTRYAIGMPLNARFLYKYTGINQTTGLYTFADLNKDGIINSRSDKYPVFMGQRYFGGLSNTFTYKGISLDFFFQFVKQTGFAFSGNYTPGTYLAAGANLPDKLLDRWRKSGDNTKYQRFAAKSSAANTAYSRYTQSDGVITDASFIRLKNVSVSWNLPQLWLDRIKVQRARVYLQGQNLLTFTKFDGMDPETQQYGQSVWLPTLRVINAGIQLTF